MEKYTNEYGKECYRGVTGDEKFTSDLFHIPEKQFDTDKQVALHTNLGSITVLDRLTGYSGGIRDTETGFRCPNGHFWLASGMRDVRLSGVETIQEAINWIKSMANTCAGE